MTWVDIHHHLKEGGFDVFSIGQHTGKCLSPYIVLRNNGQSIVYSAEIIEIEALLYYPYERYGGFEAYIEQVKARMNALYPAVKLITGPSAHYLDDDVKGYMTSLIYQTGKISSINRIRKD